MNGEDLHVFSETLQNKSMQKPLQNMLNCGARSKGLWQLKVQEVLNEKEECKSPHVPIPE
jgi:hypothetical protein